MEEKTLNKKYLLTFEERKEIENGILAGVDLKKIGQKLGRSPNTVYLEVNKNGGKHSYTAQKAQENFEQQKENTAKLRLETLSKKGYFKRIRKCDLNNRITNLEFQMEILVENIKAINEKIK